MEGPWNFSGRKTGTEVEGFDPIQRKGLTRPLPPTCQMKQQKSTENSSNLCDCQFHPHPPSRHPPSQIRRRVKNAQFLWLLPASCSPSYALRIAERTYACVCGSAPQPLAKLPFTCSGSGSLTCQLTSQATAFPQQGGGLVAGGQRSCSAASDAGSTTWRV